MKVGDIVRQGTKLIQMKENGKPRPPSKMIGTVIAIKENKLDPSIPEGWKQRLGRSVDVMWSSGRITEGFAENSLEIINSPDLLMKE